MNVETLEREEHGPGDPTGTGAAGVSRRSLVRRRFTRSRDVDFVVRAGEVVGLLGPNGAGKTTLVRVIATLLDADDGHVIVCGADVAQHPARARGHLGLAGQFASVDELLTGRENLELIGRLYGIGAADCRVRSAALLDSLGLAHAAERRVGTYSGGMRRRLDLGATLIGEPALLLLDEPTTGLDPRSRLELWDLIADIARSGTAVLVTSQNLDEIEQLADRVVVLDDGTVIADDTVDAIRQQIGGQIIDVAVDTDHLDEATTTLRGAGFDARLDPSRRRIVATTMGGLPSALAAADTLLATDVEPIEFSLRTPSLEEAFLALTDAPADQTEADTPDPGALRPLPARTPPVVVRSARHDIAVLVGRDLRRLLRSPQSLFFAAVMPVMFVLGLTAVFGNLVETVLGEGYIQFLLPGVLVMQITLAAGITGVGIATDLRDGIIDRFRSLPIAGPAVLVGRTTSDLTRNAFGAAIMIAAGFAVGYRLHGGVVGGIAALAVALLFGTRSPGCLPPSVSLSRTPRPPTSSGSRPSCSSSTSPAPGSPSTRCTRPSMASPATNRSTSPSKPSAASPTEPPPPPNGSAPSPGPSASSPRSPGSPPDSSAQQHPDRPARHRVELTAQPHAPPKPCRCRGRSPTTHASPSTTSTAGSQRARSAANGVPSNQRSSRTSSRLTPPGRNRT